MNDVTVLVLGASGRVGRHLVAGLSEIGLPVIAVSRSPRPASMPDNVTWLSRDLTRRPGEVLDELAARSPDRLVIVDLALDRETTRTMQTSIRAATTGALSQANLVANHGARVRIVSASTTAILAPIGLRTPYGRAKRHQAEQYARHGDADIVLLPQLSADGATSYEWAAAALTALLADLLTDEPPSAGGRLWVTTSSEAHKPNPISATDFLRSQIEAIRHRHDPVARRRAAHARLAMLPQPVRDQLDHHQTPSLLIRRFRRRFPAIAVHPIPAPEPARRADGHEAL